MMVIASWCPKLLFKVYHQKGVILHFFLFILISLMMWMTCTVINYFSTKLAMIIKWMKVVNFHQIACGHCIGGCWWTAGWLNIKMPSYLYRKSHCGDKTILRPSYLHNGISYTGKMTSLYWIRALMSMWRLDICNHHDDHGQMVYIRGP